MAIISTTTKSSISVKPQVVPLAPWGRGSRNARGEGVLKWDVIPEGCNRGSPPFWLLKVVEIPDRNIREWQFLFTTCCVFPRRVLICIIRSPLLGLHPTYIYFSIQPVRKTHEKTAQYHWATRNNPRYQPRPVIIKMTNTRHKTAGLQFLLFCASYRLLLAFECACLAGDPFLKRFQKQI